MKEQLKVAIGNKIDGKYGRMDGFLVWDTIRELWLDLLVQPVSDPPINAAPSILSFPVTSHHARFYPPRTFSHFWIESQNYLLLKDN